MCSIAPPPTQWLAYNRLQFVRAGCCRLSHKRGCDNAHKLFVSTIYLLQLKAVVRCAEYMQHNAVLVAH